MILRQPRNRSLAPRCLFATALVLAGAGWMTASADSRQPDSRQADSARSWYETADDQAPSESASAASEEPADDRSSEPAPQIVSAPAAFPSLAPSASPERAADEPAGSGSAPQWSSPVITIASSLSVVLGLFAGLVWLTRRFGGKTGGGGTLPPAALQPLGSRAIDARTRILMFRCGGRVLVVAQTAGGGMHPLSEITDPAEVDQLTGWCQSDSRQAFAQTIQSLEKEPAAGGFVGAETSPPDSRRRLFATG